MDDPKAWIDALISFLTWTGGVLPFELWKVICVGGSAVWAIYAIRAWRSGR